MINKGYTSQDVKEKSLEHLVRAIIEYEENHQKTYSLQFDSNFFMIEKRTQMFSMSVFKDTMHLRWFARDVTLKRAKSEEDYFQLMCTEEDYCDEEFEKAIKQLVDLHCKNMYQSCAIGGFIEGVYDNEPNGH